MRSCWNDPRTHQLVAQLHSETVTDSGVFHSLQRRFVDGVDWDETVYYQNVLSAIKDGYPWKGCADEQDLREYGQELDHIYHSIVEDGFQTQQEVTTHPTIREELANEICIDRARDSEPLWVEGQHRLSVAKLLGLDEIPVTVVVRHRE